MPNINIKNLIEVENKETKEKTFYLLKGDTWITINEEEYNNILR